MSNILGRRALRRLALLGVLCLAGPQAPVAASSHGGDPLSDSLLPHPDRSAHEVVRIQLEALRANDAADRGIAVAFRFASPSNRAQTGPLERFGAMIRNGPYALMLRYAEAIYDEIEEGGDEAQQRVVLISERETSGYVFYLSRQSNGPYTDCWMTDAVAVVPLEGAVAMH